MSHEHLKRITTRAKALRKHKPNTPWNQLVKEASKLLKPAKKAAKKAVGKAHKKRVHKKRAVGKVKSTPRKVKVKIRKTKGGNVNLGISGISLSKVKGELQHQKSLHSALVKHQAMLKGKGLKPAEKAAIRRDITHYKNAITASKKHITALKRSI